MEYIERRVILVKIVEVESRRLLRIIFNNNKIKFVVDISKFLADEIFLKIFHDEQIKSITGLRVPIERIDS